MTPYYEHDGVTIYHGDCRDVLPCIQAGALVTDPPFNVGKNYGTSQDDLPLPEYEDLLASIIGMGPEVQAWVTPTARLSMFARLLGDSARPVTVVRGAHGPKRWGWYDQFDTVLVKGRPNRYVSNLWTDIRLKGEGYYFREDTYGHPGYTPQPLLARLVGLLAAVGQTVVDPFVGTGTTLVAAKRCGVRAVGIDIDERWCEVAAKRLSQNVLPLELGA